jgi:DNA-binding response OmpR family regulator
MNAPKPLKIFVLEDDKTLQRRIRRELSATSCNISFFSKSDSVFELLKFSPDLLIHDYQKNKVTRCHEWAIPY